MRVFARAACLAAFFVLLSTAALAAEVVVPFPRVSAEFVDSGGTTRLDIPGFSATSSPGDPALPHSDTCVLLPPDADTSTLRIEIRNAVVDQAGTYSLAPSPPAVLDIDGARIEQWGPDKKIENGRNVLVYNTDQLYPSSFVTTDFESRLGGYLLVPVSFWPYRYNPVTGQISHMASGDVALVFNTKSTIRTPTVDSGLGDRLRQLAINSSDAGSMYQSTPALLQSGSTPLAIITTSAIANSSTKLAGFVTHKGNMGYSVTVATEAQWGGGTGDAAAEGIRNWLKANYATKARYVILIGNPNPASGDVPMKKLWPRHGAGDGYEDAPSDYYYADLTGNWDLDHDGFFGEYPGDFGAGGVDRVPEVIVGRIPYYGVAGDLDKILQKIMDFEIAPGVGDWVGRMLLPMKVLDANTPMYQLGEAIKTNSAAPAGLDVFRLYDDLYGLNPAPEVHPCTQSAVVAEWQKHYGFVFWASHGNTDVAASVLTSGSCPSLDDSYPSFVFEASCLNGYPESSANLGYSLLKNGAIATVSATRVSWYFPGQVSYVGSDSLGGMCYTYALRLAKDRQKCGDAFYNMNSALSNGIWMNHVVFNLYGDPTVAPRLATGLAINTLALPAATVGRSYSAALIAGGGTTPYQWTITAGALPPGLALSAAGSISGTPERSGTFWFTAVVADSAGDLMAADYTFVVKAIAYSFPFDTDPGWTVQGGWAFGRPTGAGSGSHDPVSGHSGNNVYGYNLGGDYPNNMAATEYLTTQALDCSNLVGVTLSFWRWLGVEMGTDDSATIQVSTDGLNWTTVWGNPSDYTLQDASWCQRSYDISGVADLRPTVYIRWGIGPTDSSGAYPGWNIDDVEVSACNYGAMASISAIKAAADLSSCLVQGKIVTGAYPGSFYVQDLNGYQGIRVAWTGPVTEGLPATVYGTIRTSGGEREIAADSVTQTGMAPLLRPVLITTRALGGGPCGIQQAVCGWCWVTALGGERQWLRLSASGLNNIGAFVKVAGKITRIDPLGQYFYVDDGGRIADGTLTGGDANVGVRVKWSGLGRSVGDFVTVTGISSGFTDAGYFWRELLPRRASDINP